MSQPLSLYEFLHANYVYPYTENFPNEDLELYNQHLLGEYPLDDLLLYFKRKYYEAINGYEEGGINLTYPQSEFLNNPTKNLIFLAGLGCMRGSTLIHTKEGLVPIADLTSPTQVLSWNEKSQKYQYSLSGGSYPKGKDYLYRVVTQHGEFVASANHRVFCEDHTYQYVHQLCVGDNLHFASPEQLETIEEPDQRGLLEDGHYLTQKSSDFLGSCAELNRQCGQPLLSGQDIGPDVVPSQDDAQKYAQKSSHEAQGRVDGLQEPLHKRNRPLQHDDPLCKRNYASQNEVLAVDEVNQTSTLSLAHISLYNRLQQGWLSLGKFASHHINRIFSLYHTCNGFLPAFLAKFLAYFSCSCSESSDKNTIISIERLDVKETFYDMQVLNTNNYISADGTVHHNSGKSETLEIRILMDLFAQKGANVSLYVYNPTQDMNKQNIIPRLEAYLEKLGYKDIMNKGDMFMTIPEYGKIYFKSLTDISRIIAYECMCSYVDELDTLDKDQARLAWQRICSRTRQKVEVPKDHPFYHDMNEVTPDPFNPDKRYRRNRNYGFSTPESFGFLYEYSKTLNELNGMVIAPTYSNCFLPEGYVEDVLGGYPEQLKEAYIRARFVNLNQANAWYSFNRKYNVVPELPVPIKGKELHIGMDFNYTKMTCDIGIIHEGKQYTFDARNSILDTPTMIMVIKEHYPDHKITVYPDSSGNQHKSVDASKTDLALLYKAGFNVVAPDRNTGVKERWMNTNNAFDKRKSFIVESDLTKDLIDDLEIQTIDPKTSLPDKKNDRDHSTDSHSYKVNRMFPSQRKGVTQTKAKGVG